MNGYNFTDRVRKVLQMARGEAAFLCHEYIGTEHILLGLIREGEGVAMAVLTNLDVDDEAIRRTIYETTKKGKATETAGHDLPYTSRAKMVLDLAMTETRELQHKYVGTEHLLLGLLREEKGIAAQVLRDAGVTLEQARAETLRLLGSETPTPTYSAHYSPEQIRRIVESKTALPPAQIKLEMTVRGPNIHCSACGNLIRMSLREDAAAQVLTNFKSIIDYLLKRVEELQPKPPTSSDA